MEKLKIINDAVAGIRTALNADCAYITELPALVQGVVNNMGGSGYTTSIVFSNKEERPNVPTASILDINTGLVKELDEDWSHMPSETESPYVWVSFAIFNPVGFIMSEWSSPINIKGEKGDTGEQGIPGVQGEKGDTGEAGPVGPMGPVGPAGADGKDGSNGENGKDGITPSFKIENDYWFVSYDNGNNWTELGKARGEDGQDGADGKDGVDGTNGQDGAQGEKGEPGEITEEDKTEIINAAAAQALTNIEGAYYTKEEIDTLKQSLNTAINTGDEKAIADAEAALNTANSFNASLASLKSKFVVNEDGTVGVLKNDSLNPSDIYDLSVAALGDDIADSEGELHENALFAKQIVSVISTFGTVKADNITGNTISGKTLQSDTSVSDSDADPTWQLNNDGSGHLANKHISWTSEGELTIDGIPVATQDDAKQTITLEIGGDKFFTLHLDTDNNNEKYIESAHAFVAPSVTATSDMTLKDVVKNVELTVDELANAPTFVFDWKDGSGRSVGTSAQYWQDVLPEAVLKGNNDKLSLAYGNTALVGMVSLARKVREQEERITKLETLVEDLLNKLS